MEKNRMSSRGVGILSVQKIKEKPTFRTMVNFDKSPNHVIYRRIEKKNVRRAISAPPTTNLAMDIGIETVDRAFKVWR